jgi:hypothetical protein
MYASKGISAEAWKSLKPTICFVKTLGLVTEERKSTLEVTSVHKGKALN